MAFARSAGYNSLPNGVFVPEIFSKKAQRAYRKTAVFEDIANTDYFGEISQMGDTVHIIKEPEISVSNYSRGQQVTPQDLEDEDFTLIVDKANVFAFKVDDIEKKQSHMNWEDLASNRAGYKMSDQMDMECFGYLSGFKQSTLGSPADTARVAADKSGTDPISTVDADGLLASMKLTRGDFSSNFGTAGTASHSIPVGPNPTAGTSNFASPLQILNRMKRFLDTQNVPDDGSRWFVADPVFFEILGDENSKLLDRDHNGSDGDAILRNGKITSGLIRGFKLYQSNNLPRIGSGPGTSGTSSQITNYGVIIAGHKDAIAHASQLNKTESFRDPDSFADVVRGLQLYGRKILRPEALTVAYYNLA